MLYLQGASAVVFCIGGPYGHGPQVRERANVSVKLSTMVLNHQVAFLVLLEQIYRFQSKPLLVESCLLFNNCRNDFCFEVSVELAFMLGNVGVLLQGVDNTSW